MASFAECSIEIFRRVSHRWRLSSVLFGKEGIRYARLASYMTLASMSYDAVSSLNSVVLSELAVCRHANGMV